jgi:hypothetical protein
MHFYGRWETKSEWLNLTKGEKYYMYGKQLENTGGDNFVVGVEIK